MPMQDIYKKKRKMVLETDINGSSFFFLFFPVAGGGKGEGSKDSGQD